MRTQLGVGGFERGGRFGDTVSDEDGGDGAKVSFIDVEPLLNKTVVVGLGGIGYVGVACLTMPWLAGANEVNDGCFWTMTFVGGSISDVSSSDSTEHSISTKNSKLNV